MPRISIQKTKSPPHLGQMGCSPGLFSTPVNRLVASGFDVTTGVPNSGWTHPRASLPGGG